MKERGVKRRNQKIALVTGGAGFIGSNLCDRLMDEGAQVVCIDNFQTGRADNLAHLERESRFEFVEHDVIDNLPQWLRGGRVKFTHIYHLACAASPPHYQADPEHTLLTNVLGTRNLLRLAEDDGATPGERQNAYTRARAELDGIIALPAVTRASIERKLAGELEA